MLSNHIILCRPLLLLPSIFPSIRVFSNESVLRIRWPKYCSFSSSVCPSNEYSRLISFRIDWIECILPPNSHVEALTPNVLVLPLEGNQVYVGPWVWGPHDGISGFMEEEGQREHSEKATVCKTGRVPHPESNQLPPFSWTFSLQNCEKYMFVV